MKTSPTQPANRLIHEKSPYLLQHAHNPVQWYPWGTEAFEASKRLNKPIFLSIGYSTCHWCHVMEQESFTHEETARLLNEHFISIKVDREERPDIDRVYMLFVQGMTGRGGWPLNVWLTPKLKPFFGGTYFPLDDASSIMSLRTVSRQIAMEWKKNSDRIDAHSEQMTARLQELARGHAPIFQHLAADTTEIHAQCTAAYESFAGSFDAIHGGFGAAPKFPHPAALDFLLRYSQANRHLDQTSSKNALSMALRTLRKMAEGGIQDHLGGGFHRYAVDGAWRVPHFEKMLYDQAQLAIVYLNAFSISNDSYFADVSQNILGYIFRNMMAPEGGFYSAEDADSTPLSGGEPVEGAYYVWTLNEIREPLDALEIKTFTARFGITEAGNIPAEFDIRHELKGQNVLAVARSLNELAHEFQRPASEIQACLERAAHKLHAVRALRPEPARDDKIIVSWNGLMISALAQAGRVLNQPLYTKAAIHAAQGLQKNLYHPATGELSRCYREGASAVHGFAEDYAFLIAGLLDLHQVTGESSWLEWAFSLQEKQDALFWDANHDGYFSESANDPSLLWRGKDFFDSAEPSNNSVSVQNLLRMAMILDKPAMREKAMTLLHLSLVEQEQPPITMPRMLSAAIFSQTQSMSCTCDDPMCRPAPPPPSHDLHKH